jgi:hypothetical protein
MNNVDDGIEIWGGCVDIKYFSIWNVGDDSFDLDHHLRHVPAILERALGAPAPPGGPA